MGMTLIHRNGIINYEYIFRVTTYLKINEDYQKRFVTYYRVLIIRRSRGYFFMCYTLKGESVLIFQQVVVGTR